MSENGLQIRRWRIAERPGVMGNALMTYARGEVLDDVVRRGLERNGLRLVRIDAEEIDSLLARLGGATLDVDGWFGQTYDWRQIVAWPIDPAGHALAVDGRVRRVQGGTLALMIRGWTIPMEDGPRLQLEMQPVYERSHPSQISQLLGQQSFDGEAISTMFVDVLLEVGYAYVLTCESPGVEWVRVDTLEGEEVDEEQAEVEDLDAAGPKKSGGAGPEAAAPMTVGEVLMRVQTTPAGREMLVFVPRIPAMLFPPQDASEQADVAMEGDS